MNINVHRFCLNQIDSPYDDKLIQKVLRHVNEYPSAAYVNPGECKLQTFNLQFYVIAFRLIII